VSRSMTDQSTANEQLWKASERGEQDQVVQAIHQLRADVNSTDWFGWTALHWAVSGQHVGTTQTLLNSKANILAQDQTGETVLHWAAANNNMSMVQMLLDHGASVDLCNKDGKIPADLTQLPGIRELCSPAAADQFGGGHPGGIPAPPPGPHDLRYAQIPGGEGNATALMASIAAEQKARAHIQRKLMMMSELQRTLEDYKVQFVRATAERKEAEHRLQAIRPQLERERRGREEAERSLRDMRANIEDHVKQLDDANEKILVAREFAGQIEEIKRARELVTTERKSEWEKIRELKGEVDKATNELKKLKEDGQHATNAISGKKSEVENASRQSEELKDKKSDQADEKAKLADENAELDSLLASFKKEEDKENANRTKEEAAEKDLLKKKSDEEENQRKFQDEIKTKERELQELEKQNRDLQREIDHIGT